MFDLLQFILDILSVFLGVVFAFLFERYRGRQNQRKDAREVLTMLRDELRQNLPILRQLLPPLKKVESKEEEKGIGEASYFIPFTLLDLRSGTSLSNKLPAIGNAILVAKINGLYYDYGLFEKAMEKYQVLVFERLKVGSWSPDLRSMADRYVESFVAFIGKPSTGLIDKTDQLISEIEPQIAKLDC